MSFIGAVYVEYTGMGFFPTFNLFHTAKVLLIHAGGYSQRLPSVSVLGKAFLALPFGGCEHCALKCVVIVFIHLRTFLPYSVNFYSPLSPPPSLLFPLSLPPLLFLSPSLPLFSFFSLASFPSPFFCFFSLPPLLLSCAFWSGNPMFQMLEAVLMMFIDLPARMAPGVRCC